MAGSDAADAILFQPFEPEELARLVDRLLELSRTERALAERAARAGVAVTDELLSVAAHDLRNPLATIVAALPLLEFASPGSDLERRARSSIARQVTRLTGLVELLEVGRRAPAEGEVSLGELLPRVAPENATICLPPEPVVVAGDEDQLACVFAHLLDAARPAEGATMMVRLERDPARGVARVTVGHGGPPRGLSLLRLLVQRHGGTLCHRATAGGGDLLVELPLVAPAIEVDAPVAPERVARVRRAG